MLANDCQTSKFGIERCRFDLFPANPCTYSCLADCVHISACSVTSIAYAMDFVTFSESALRLLSPQSNTVFATGLLNLDIVCHHKAVSNNESSRSHPSPLTPSQHYRHSPPSPSMRCPSRNTQPSQTPSSPTRRTTKSAASIPPHPRSKSERLGRCGTRSKNEVSLTLFLSYCPFTPSCLREEPPTLSPRSFEEQPACINQSLYSLPLPPSYQTAIT